jgi:hypothetical protein
LAKEGGERNIIDVQTMLLAPMLDSEFPLPEK